MAKVPMAQILINGSNYSFEKEEWAQIVRALTEKALADKEFSDKYQGFLSAMFREVGYEAIMKGERK